jgi:hypothetical protein
MLLSEKCEEGCIYAELAGMQHHQCHGTCAALEEEDREAADTARHTPEGAIFAQPKPHQRLRRA